MNLDGRALEIYKALPENDQAELKRFAVFLGVRAELRRIKASLAEKDCPMLREELERLKVQYRAMVLDSDNSAPATP